MAIFLNGGLFFDFAELSLAPTASLGEADLSFSFNLSNHPPIYQTGKLAGKLGRKKEAKPELSVYIRRVQ